MVGSGALIAIGDQILQRWRMYMGRVIYMNDFQFANIRCDIYIIHSFIIKLLYMHVLKARDPADYCDVCV